MIAVVGITGSFATGKTFVASLFKGFGLKVIDADRLAHDTLKKGSLTYKRIVRVFGGEILDEEKKIDRRKLGRTVFRDRRRLTTLNRIIHPVVVRKIRDQIRKSGKKKAVVIDAPLLLEAGLGNLVDVLIVVKTSREEQIRRGVRKFGITKEECRRRISCQMPLKQKMKMADFVVDNDGTKSETKRKVKEIWEKIVK